MASLPCDMCDAEPGGAMFTNLDNGDTLTIGATCMLTFTLATAAELAKMLPDDQRGTYADLAGEIAAALLPTIPLADGGRGSISGQRKGRGRAAKTTTLAEWQAGTDMPSALESAAAGEPLAPDDAGHDQAPAAVTEAAAEGSES